MTVNGEFPGPTLHARKGETLIVNVVNQSQHNVIIHWHGVKQIQYPWSDGPAYIIQCPIQPGGRFAQKIVLSSEEVTLWWHAHSDWSRATVYGALVIHPEKGDSYPFPKHHKEVPIILGEWWKEDIWTLYRYFEQSGGGPNISHAYTINGQPGDLYPCSKSDTFKKKVDKGKTFLLRLINSALQDIMFFSIANHKFTVVGTDASHTKPFEADYVTIPPGQTLDVLLEANQLKNHYYMAARAYSSTVGVDFDNTTTTAILQYDGNYTPSSNLSLPPLPLYNDTSASVNFTGRLRGLDEKRNPFSCPQSVTYPLYFAISVNSFPCASANSSNMSGSEQQ